MMAVQANSRCFSSDPLRVLERRMMRKVGNILAPPDHAGGSAIGLSATGGLRIEPLPVMHDNLPRTVWFNRELVRAVATVRGDRASAKLGGVVQSGIGLRGVDAMARRLRACVREQSTVRSRRTRTQASVQPIPMLRAIRLSRNVRPNDAHHQEYHFGRDRHRHSARQMPAWLHDPISSRRILDFRKDSLSDTCETSRRNASRSTFPEKGYSL
jgi:hypothetical protein